MKAGDYDTVFAGATSARFSALQSGAVDAAILLPPFNFYAESAGFTNLGLTIDYAKELPFTGTVVGRALASARKAVLDKVLWVNSKSMAWFSDPANRTEAIKIMVEASRLKEEDVAKSYDFLHENQFFEKTGMVSKTKMDALLNALKSLGDVGMPRELCTLDPHPGLQVADERSDAGTANRETLTGGEAVDLAFDIEDPMNVG